jgi:hypothetical protein
MRASPGNVFCGKEWQPSGGHQARGRRISLLILSVAAAWLSVSGSQAVTRSSEPVSGLPFFFEPRATSAGAQFLARGLNYQFWIAPTEVQFALCRQLVPAADSPALWHHPPPSTSVQARVARMLFVGANQQARLEGCDELDGKVNYLIGQDPAQWRQRVPTFGKVRVREVYPGIDLVYYGNQQQLEYDFVVSPRANPSEIRIHFDGVDSVAVSVHGELVLTLADGEIRQHRPAFYQIRDGVRHDAKGGYRLVGRNTVAFSLQQYDPRFALVIDPILSYSSYFGGKGGESGTAIKVDSNASIYIAGQTLSTQFPFSIPATPFQGTFKGGQGDAFVAKLDNTGSKLIYFTYLGGSGSDSAYDLAIDNTGNVYLTGYTDSPDFPIQNAAFPHISGVEDPTFHIFPLEAFVAKLNATGSALVFSTYLGGSDNDVGGGIAVDQAGSVYVTGYSYSTDFPLQNPYKNFRGGNDDIFVAKFVPSGTSLVYSTYIGGNGFDEGEGIAVDADGSAYIAGYTTSTNFPTTPNAPGKVINAASGAVAVYDAFVTKMAADGLSLVYSTYLGGTNNDFAYRITLDSARNAYVAGTTQSPGFPHNGVVDGLAIGNIGTNVNFDAFLTKFDSGGTPVYSDMFGGSSDDQAWGIAVDGAGRAFIIGTTLSTNFPTFASDGVLHSYNAGRKDVFVTAIETNGLSALYSGSLGGLQDDYGYGIAVDAEGNAYITGLTFSSNFPVSSNPFQGSLQGQSSSFFAKLRLSPPTLGFAAQGNTLQFSWPVSAPDYLLQMTSSLGATASWVPVPQTPVLSNGSYLVTLGTTNAAGFFRLQRP